MRIILVLLVLIVSCENATERSVGFSKVNNPLEHPVETKRRWKLYKVDSVIKYIDVPSAEDRYIVIGGLNYSYYISDSLALIDTLIPDTSFSYKVYTFKKNRNDRLFFLKEDSSEIVLKHFGYEGDYEYFKIDSGRVVSLRNSVR